jgi:DNA-binding transcriptional ArsR family regulator
MATVASTQVINEKHIDRAAEILRALAHPIRLRIIEFIDANKSINVNKIYGSLKLEQSITSQHLRILRAADIVKTDRNGKFIIYSVNYEKVGYYLNTIEEYLQIKR